MPSQGRNSGATWLILLPCYFMKLRTRARSIDPWRCRLLRTDVPRQHPLQHAVAHDQRVKQNRPEVSDEREEKKVRENRVRPPQHRIEHRIVRQDERQMQRPEENNRVARSR